MTWLFPLSVVDRDQASNDSIIIEFSTEPIITIRIEMSLALEAEMPTDIVTLTPINLSDKWSKVARDRIRLKKMTLGHLPR